MGLLIGMTIIASIKTTSSSNPAGHPVSVEKPDYLATIRAPTPKPDPSAETEEHEVPIREQDFEQLTQYMIASAQHDATAMTALNSKSKLMNLIVGNDKTAGCYQSLQKAVVQMATTGRLLQRTDPLSQNTSECLNVAFSSANENNYQEAHQNEREEKTKAFLQTYVKANNPSIIRAAKEPSPENMMLWRTATLWHTNCIEGIPERAATVAAINDPEQAADKLRENAEEMVECMKQNEMQLIESIRGVPQVPSQNKE